MNDEFHARLDGFLQATADRYEVHETLKSTPTETTQVVYRRTQGTADAHAGSDRGATHAFGPFVRKIFVGTDGRGSAYERIMAAQTRGIRFAHQPFVYDIERTNNTLEVVMEYVRGTTLHETIQREGPSVELVRRVGTTLCEAATELHEALDDPIIHRDIKPSNVMLATDGRVILVDLGIARSWHEGAARDTVRYGTPGFAPPEQFGYGQTSVRSDVFSIGMTLAFCLLGSMPSQELIEQGFEDVRIPARLRPVLARATQFDPKARHESARALSVQINAALQNGTAPAQPGPARQEASGNGKPEHIPLAWLGRLWNTLLALVWLLLVVACVLLTIKPQSGSQIESWPFWFRILGFFAVIILPVGAVAYLAMDKRRLRSHPLFAGRTWLQEFLICLALVFGWLAVAVLVYALFVQP